ncbi:MAG: hypothetical protein ACI9ZM_001288 [Paracoccaceae bacterium]
MIKTLEFETTFGEVTEMPNGIHDANPNLQEKKDPNDPNDPNDTEFWALPLLQVTILSQRLYRECHAMLAYASGNGTQIGATALDLLGVLEKKPSDIGGADLPELAKLHQSLAKAVEPSRPSTLELIAWERRKYPRWSRVAPVYAMRTLMGLALIGFLLTFLLPVSGYVTAELISEPFFGLKSKGNPSINWTDRSAMLLFYTGVAGLGACFSALYDASKYVSDGTYDPMMGANYPMRILLGVISGVLLAQVLSDFSGKSVSTDPQSQGGFDALNLVGKPVLALVGGFASLFVYEALQQMTEGLRAIFRPTRAVEAEIQRREIQNKETEKRLAERAERAKRALKLAGQIKSTSAGTAQQALIDEMVRLAGLDGDGDGEDPRTTSISLIKAEIAELEAANADPSTDPAKQKENEKAIGDLKGAIEALRKRGSGSA